MHALIKDNQIQQVGQLPRIWWDGERYWDWRTDQSTTEAQGWVEVQRTPRPDDTDTTTHDYTVELQDGVPVEAWTVREWTETELNARATQAVEQQLIADTAADLGRIDAAISQLQTLLGDNTVDGSIRAWRAGVTNSYAVGDMRALADLLIADAQATRRIARQTLRLARVLAGDYTSADVGPE